MPPDGTTLNEVKISELPVATAAHTTDKLEASQVDPSLGFVSRSITVAQVATVVAGTLPAPPTTLPPSGAAGGALTGTYPNPTLVGGPLSNYALASSIPTTLPPSGSAGGGLSGSYPNPTIRPSTTNGDVLTTVAGVSAWAAPTGGGGTATLATGAVGYGSATNVLTGVLADFSWDATQKRLGVGTSTPGALAEFRSATAGTKALIVRGTTTSASQDYFDVVLTDPTGGGGSAMRVMGGATGINPLFQVDRAGDTQVSGWLRVLSTSGLVTNGADYFGAMLGNGAGGNLGTFAGLGAPTFSTFGSYGSIYLNGSSPGLPYYNNNGTTGWDRLVGETATQTLSNKTFGATTFTGAITGTTATFSGNFNVTSTGFADVEIGGATGALLDLKVPTTDDFDLRLITTGNGGSVVVPSGQTLTLDAATTNLTGALTSTTATFSSTLQAGRTGLNGATPDATAGLTFGTTLGFKGIQVYDDGTAISGFGITANTLNIYSAGNQVKIGTGGLKASSGSMTDVMTIVAANVFPSTNNATTLGHASFRWSNIYGVAGDFTGTVMAPGAQIQMVSVETGAVATGTTVIPNDDTIPQQTEGDQYMTLAITPKSATSKLIIEVVWNGSNSAASTNIIAALFQDATANALAVGAGTSLSGAMYLPIGFRHVMTSGTTSATTFKVRVGGTSAGTTTFNGQSGARTMGGVMASSIVIREVAP